MQFSRPSLSHLVSRIQSDLASQLGLSLPLENHSIVSALTYALAGATHLVYGRRNFIANKNCLLTRQQENIWTVWVLRLAAQQQDAPRPKLN